MNRKIYKIIIGLIISTVGLSACTSEPIDEENINIVASSFAPYDWTKQIIGDLDNYNLTLLQDDGIDLHSYSPTVEDIAAISDSDMFIYVGGESDEWVDDALAEARNKDMIVINLLEVLGDGSKEEEIKEGMEDEDHDHDEEHAHENEHSHEEVVYDEHVWLSLENAEIFIEEITKALTTIDGANADILKQNSNDYINQLATLDGEYQEEVANANGDTLVFGDRYPFRYLFDDYELDYYAAFVGCSAETEASFETIVFLANKIDELNSNYVMTIDGSDSKIANTIIENTTNKDQHVLELNSMQSITNVDIESGATYLSIMKENLEVLKTALN